MNDIDSRELRNAFGTFVTGVTVVTTMDAEGLPRGFTANSFTSVSLDPPLVLICIAKAASTLSAFAGAKGYAVNILAEGQRDLSGHFASKLPDKFTGLDWVAGPADNPLLPDVVAWFDCTMQGQVDAGDHLILIGRVLGFSYNSHNPLGYCRGAYLEFGLELEAVQARGSDVHVGAIIERDLQLLLFADGALLSLPTAQTIGSKQDEGSLIGVLTAVGVEVELGFLFSVFEGAGSMWIYYRGVAGEGRVASNAAFYPLSDIPWERISDRNVRTMLRRYVEERAEDQFGVYVSQTVAGRIKALKRSP